MRQFNVLLIFLFFLTTKMWANSLFTPSSMGVEGNDHTFINAKVGVDAFEGKIETIELDLLSARLEDPGDCIESAPSNLGANSITNTTATITWDAVPNANYYQIWSPFTGNVNVGNNLNYDFSELPSGTNIYWQVRASCIGGGFSPWANSSFTTEGTNACLSAAPTGLGAFTILFTSATIFWEEVENASSYQIWSSFTGNINVGSNLEYDFTDLPSGASINWQVRAVCIGGGFSPWANSSFTTLGENCSATPPSNLEVDNIFNNSATVTWDPVPNASSYQIWSLYTGNVNVGTDLSYDFSELPSGSINWQVRASCIGGGFSPWANSTFENGFNACEIFGPGGLFEFNIESSSATVSWAEVENANYYQIWSSFTGNVNVGSNTSYDFSGLPSGTNINWQVRAYCSGGGFSPWANSSFTTTGPNICTTSAPSNLGNSNVTENSASVGWNSVPNASSYQIWSSFTGNVNVGTNLSYNFSGLPSGTNINWQVRASCSGGGFSPWANSSFATTGPNICPTSAPSNLGANSITNNSATVTWNSVPNASSYQIWSSFTGIVNVGIFSYNFSGLPSGTNINWQVRASCSGGGFSPWANSSFTTTGPNICTTSAPSNLGNSNVTENSATVTWNSVPNASSYQIWSSFTGNVNVGTNLSYNFSGLPSGTNINWQVRASCTGGGFSPWANSSFTTTGPNICTTSAPSNLGANSITNNSATVTWNSVPNASSYQIWSSFTGNVNVGTNLSYNFSELPAGTNIYWQVRASCIGGGFSPWANSSFFTQVECLEDGNPPVNLMVFALTENSATIAWDPSRELVLIRFLFHHLILYPRKQGNMIYQNSLLTQFIIGK
jgi:hypothetical protein